MPLRLRVAGEDIELYGDRALYWPARARLLIADLHLGKADIFRQAGIALPRGGTAGDLARLSSLLMVTGARSLWVLGDLLHGAAIDSHWRGSWEAWRGTHCDLEVAVLAGNHDRALASADLAITSLGDSCEDGPFELKHLPGASGLGRHVLCGHLHPLVMIPGAPRRWPAFWLSPHQTILPAFSAFTGGQVAVPAPGDRLLACVEGALVEAPAPCATPDGRSRGKRRSA